VVEYESTNKLAFCRHFVLHMHDLNHMEIDLSLPANILVTRTLLRNCLDGVD
jgi:hypothetical protein